MKDYRLTMKVRNNRILVAMEKKGFKSVSELCRAMGTQNEGTIGKIINLTGSVLDKRTGDFTPLVMRLCEVLNAMPSDLFSEEQLYHPLDKNTAEVEISLEEIGGLITNQTPYEILEAKETSAIIDRALTQLHEKEADAIKRHFGIDGEELTLREIAERDKVCTERVRQREAKGLRKFRNPHNKATLAFLDPEKD